MQLHVVEPYRLWLVSVSMEWHEKDEGIRLVFRPRSSANGDGCNSNNEVGSGAILDSPRVTATGEIGGLTCRDEQSKRVGAAGQILPLVLKKEAGAGREGVVFR